MTDRHPSKSIWQRFNFLLFIIGGIGLLIGGLVYYLSPLTRMNLNGVKLGHGTALSKPANYLLGWKSQFDSWTERGGRLDTPLAMETNEEIGTLVIERLRGPSNQNVLLAKPYEWIRSLKNAEGFKNQTIPLNHPSIAEGMVLLDNQGTVLDRRQGRAPAALIPDATSKIAATEHPIVGWRVGRTLPFLFPKFPKGALHPGNTWTEHIEWIDVSGEWTIAWQAELRWVLKDMEILYGKPFARLLYEAALQPSLLQAPTWVHGSASDLQFTGEGTGEALYDVKNKFLISNTFSYAGVLKMHIPNLDKVPEELRVGQATAASEGDVVLKFDNKLDVRLP